MDIIRGYTIFSGDTQQRNTVAGRPLVVDVMDLRDSMGEDYYRHIETFYPIAVGHLGRKVGLEVTVALRVCHE